jgi:siroheme synthase
MSMPPVEPSAFLQPPDAVPGWGCVLLVAADAAQTAELQRPAVAALAGADAVLHDQDVDPRLLALVPRGAFVEPVGPGHDRVPARTAGIARACRLAADGWRVVWLIAGDFSRAPAELAGLAEAGIAVRTCTDSSASAMEAVFADRGGPQPLATAFNGLAG